MLNGQQKKYLRREAQNMKAIFQVGKDGVSEKQIQSILDALKAKELVKVKLLQTCPMSVNEAAIEIAAGTKSEVVHIIGHTIIFYRKSDKVLYKLP